MLDAAVYEEIEADRGADMQSALVVLSVTGAGGMAGIALGLIGISGFLTGAIVALGGWLVWVSLIATIGTTALAEPQTKSNSRELLRTLGYAAGPGVILVFATMSSAAMLVFVVVSLWMIAAAVMAVRQALDFRSVGRAVAVCVIAWLLAIGCVALIALVTSRAVT